MYKLRLPRHSLRSAHHVLKCTAPSSKRCKTAPIHLFTSSRHLSTTPPQPPHPTPPPPPHSNPPPRFNRATRAAIFVGITSVAYYILAAYIYTRPTSTPHFLDPTAHLPYTLLSKTPISPTSNLYTLRATSQPPSSPLNATTTTQSPSPDKGAAKSKRNEHGGHLISQAEIDRVARSPSGSGKRRGEVEEYVYGKEWEMGLWSVTLANPQIQIERAYTPLPHSPLSSPSTPNQNSNLRFLIRTEGEVARYLDRLPLGAKVGVRGPKQEFDFGAGKGGKGEEVSEIVFLAGGTGIAAGLQVAYALMGNGEGGWNGRMRILWANRREQEAVGGVSRWSGNKRWLGMGGKSAVKNEGEGGEMNLIVQEIKELERKSAGRVKVDYLFDDQGVFIDSGKIRQVCEEVRSAGREEGKRRLLMVCGSEGFVEYLAGPKGIVGGKVVQGAVAGEIGKAGWKGWEVVKL